jgi:hypothetical protein
VAKRKKTNVYRFRGEIAALEERIARCKSKLADPKDPDAKEWLMRWLRAAERRLSEKERSIKAKERNLRHKRS